MPIASYAVDIGVYNLGVKGQILASTTTAWARADDGARTFDEFKYSGTSEGGVFSESAQQKWSCGRNIRRLVERIDADIAAGFAVSLGLEAPMWFPIELDQSAKLQLFKPRFDDERGSEWYLQSGAAATVKAISIATMLVGLLTRRQPGLLLTTDPISASDRTVVLYEAFVASKFKVAPPAGVAQAGNEWDAFTASLAWGAVNRGFIVPPSLFPKKLHEAGSSECEIASVWQIIANLVPAKPIIDGPRDCQIVGLTELVSSELSAAQE